jgi:protein-tyrosine phosphatase
MGKIVKNIRKVVKEIIWYFYGLMIKNPRLPERVNSVLYICQGNIIRSVFAEKLSRRLLNESVKTDVNFFSAGLLAKENSRSPDNAIEAAKIFGIDLNSHRSQPVKSETANKVDMIICMETWHMKLLKKLYPQYHSKIYLMPLFLKKGETKGYYRKYNIPDPYGKTPEVFESSFTMIDRALINLMSQYYDLNISENKQKIAG